MEILEAIRTRRSIRGFKPDPVPRKVLERLLDDCRWAPSASNTQPWELAVMGGRTIEEFKDRLVEKMLAEWDTEKLAFRETHPDIPYPPNRAPFNRRAQDIRARIDAHQFPAGTPGLEAKRHAYLLYGGRLYGAPNAIIVYTEKSACPKAILDIGLLIQNISLGALAYGLGTCQMTMPVCWPELLRDLLKIPENKLIGLAIAIGYPDEKAKVNSFERPREPLDSFTHWYDV